MTFSTGQLIFALVFLFSFLVVIIYLYAKDKNVRQRHYKGFYWVFAIIIGVVLFYYILVKFLGNG